MLGVTWGTGQVLLDMLWFFLLVIEIWLMITIFIDIFRRHDMKGWLKAIWVVAVILFPLIGIILYLIIYGDQMRVHAIQAAQEQESAMRAYVQDVARSPVDDLHRLADLKDRGVISDQEFEQMKARILSGEPPTGASSGATSPS